MSVFDTSFENKTLSKELQDYKVKSIFEIERLQDYICLKGRVTRLQERKDYKNLFKGETAILDLNFGLENWTYLLSSESIFL